MPKCSIDKESGLASIVGKDDDSCMSYPGGKGRMYQRIISMIPPHETYIETHLGGGAVMRAKRPARRNIGIDIDDAVAARWEGYAGFEMVVGDALTFLRQFEFDGSEFVYCDPPYLPATRRGGRIYRHEYTVADHEGLLDTLNGLPCAIMISGYPSQLYSRILADWHCTRSLERTQAGPAIECIWTNFEPPVVLHDHGHVGENYREREAIRRKRERMLARILAMPDLERGALFSELALIEPSLLAKALEAAR